MNQQQEKKELLELLEAKEKELQYNKITALFPDEGPYRRELYPKHIAFMNAGRYFKQRAFIAANRVGKSICGGTEMTFHLTGEYPEWWEGRVFNNPIEAWTAGKTAQAVKEVQQKILLGSIEDIGSGLIPKDKIIKITKKPGVADAVEAVYVRHTSGGISELIFKAYDQKRDAFQGTKKQFIWLDEEPRDPGIYSECLTRTMDAHAPGAIICTFTPLFGLSDVVMDFLPEGRFPHDCINGHKYVTQVTWDEVPHLSETEKQELLDTYSKHEREARTKGIPSLGSGAIYPYVEDSLAVEPFPIPPWWSRAYGLDTGWKKTAAVWGALNPDDGVFYIYSEHYAGEVHPAIHANAIKARGRWMWGAADAQGVNQSDGRKIFDMYEDEGLNLIKAEKKDREGGILKVGQMFEAGKLKIFTTCRNLLAERRVYRRDERGKIIEKHDHALDALRYLCTTGIDYLELPPDDEVDLGDFLDDMPRDEFTGY